MTFVVPQTPSWRPENHKAHPRCPSGQLGLRLPWYWDLRGFGLESRPAELQAYRPVSAADERLGRGVMPLGAVLRRRSPRIDSRSPHHDPLGGELLLGAPQRMHAAIAPATEQGRRDERQIASPQITPAEMPADPARSHRARNVHFRQPRHSRPRPRPLCVPVDRPEMPPARLGERHAASPDRSSTK